MLIQRGKLNKEHYSNLKDEVSILYQEILKKKIESLSVLLKKENKKQFKKIKEEIEDAHSKGKINELHYNLLNKKISEFEVNKSAETQQTEDSVIDDVTDIQYPSKENIYGETQLKPTTHIIEQIIEKEDKEFKIILNKIK